MNTKNCVTHSFACDCREEKFRKLEEENEILREAVRHYAGVPFKTNDIYMDIFDLFTVVNSSVTEFDSDTFKTKAVEALKKCEGNK